MAYEERKEIYKKANIPLKESCRLYSKEKHRCNALNATYCEREQDCSFYKPERSET